MRTSIFPHKRSDGNFSVAIRYLLFGGDTAIRAIQEHVNTWAESKKSRDGLDLAAELEFPPRVELVDPQTIQIVFECRSSAFLWKGLMVELAGELRTVDGIERLGFWDLVTGIAHPASLA